MKNLKLATTFLGCFLAFSMVTAADAGWFKKDRHKNRTEKNEEEMKPCRFDNHPPMYFLKGMLSRSVHSGWKIDETPLYVAKDCTISMVGEEEGWLESGRDAVVMGARMGDGIVARSIVVYQPSYGSLGSGSSEEPKESGPNPNVGKIVRPAE
jgi:hypothetical protein